MKKITVLAASALVAVLCSCGGSKQVAESGATKSENPFGETYEAPCQVYDTKDNFAATGIYRGSSMQRAELEDNAQELAKRLIRGKFSHSYKGMISDYSSTIGNNRGNDINTKLERAGDQILDIVMNDIAAKCIRFSKVFDDGTQECYVAIEVPKEVIAEKVARQVADVLTEEEKEKINFNEYNYRKQMEERLRNYKEEQQ